MVSIILSIITVNFLYQLYMKIFGLSHMGVNVQNKITMMIVFALFYFSYLGI